MSDRMRIETEQPVLLSGVEAGVIVPTGSEMTLLDSTTALLNAGNTYQSAAFIDISDYRHIVGTIFADQPGCRGQQSQITWIDCRPAQRH